MVGGNELTMNCEKKQQHQRMEHINGSFSHTQSPPVVIVMVIHHNKNCITQPTSTLVSDVGSPTPTDCVSKIWPLSVGVALR